MYACLAASADNARAQSYSGVPRWRVRRRALAALGSSRMPPSTSTRLPIELAKGAACDVRVSICIRRPCTSSTQFSSAALACPLPDSRSTGLSKDATQAPALVCPSSSPKVLRLPPSWGWTQSSATGQCCCARDLFAGHCLLQEPPLKAQHFSIAFPTSVCTLPGPPTTFHSRKDNSSVILQIIARVLQGPPVLFHGRHPEWRPSSLLSHSHRRR